MNTTNTELKYLLNNEKLNQLRRWNKHFVKKNAKLEDQHIKDQEEIKRLHEMIGRQEMQIYILECKSIQESYSPKRSTNEIGGPSLHVDDLCSEEEFLYRNVHSDTCPPKLMRMTNNLLDPYGTYHIDDPFTIIKYPSINPNITPDSSKLLAELDKYMLEKNIDDAQTRYYNYIDKQLERSVELDYYNYIDPQLEQSVESGSNKVEWLE
jgi:hypothetical protein